MDEVRDRGAWVGWDQPHLALLPLMLGKTAAREVGMIGIVALAIVVWGVVEWVRS